MVTVTVYEKRMFFVIVKQYEKVAKLVLDEAYGGKGTQAFQAAIEAKKAQYEAKGEILTDEEAEKEIVAEWFRENAFSDSGKLAEFIAENYRTFGQNFMKKIPDTLKRAGDLFNRIRGKKSDASFKEKLQNRLADAMYKTSRKNSVDMGMNALAEGYGLIEENLDNKGDSVVQYDIEKGDQYRATWTIEEGVLDNSEVSRVYSQISEINAGSNAFYQASNGEYILQAKNKFVFTDAEYYFPKISSVVEVNTESGSLLDYAKECIHNGSEFGYEFDVVKEIIEAATGEGTVKRTDFSSHTANKSLQDIGRKRDVGETNDSNSRKNVVLGEKKFFIPSESKDADDKYFSKPGVLDLEIEAEHRQQVEAVAEKTGKTVEDVERVVQETEEKVEGDEEENQPDVELADEETVSTITAAYDTEYDDLEAEWEDLLNSKAVKSFADDLAEKRAEKLKKPSVKEVAEGFAQKDSAKRAAYAKAFAEEYGSEHLKNQGLSKEEIEFAMKQDEIETGTAKSLYRLKAEREYYQKLREQTDALADGLELEKLADPDFRRDVKS